MHIISFILSPAFLIAFTIIILLVYGMKKHNNFLDVRDIVKQHFKSFNGSLQQFTIFYFIPALSAFAIVQLNVIDAGLLENINLVVSIFISTFFSMLSIVTSYSETKNDYYNKTLKQTVSTISFQIILCVATLVLSFLYQFMGKKMCYSVYALSSFLIYYLIFVMLLNMFMIIKRLNVLHNQRKNGGGSTTENKK